MLAGLIKTRTTDDIHPPECEIMDAARLECCVRPLPCINRHFTYTGFETCA